MHIIRTNNQPRDLITIGELSDKERANFDWLDPSATDGFFRYQGEVYHLSQFIRLEGALPGWDGMNPTSATTGILVRGLDGKVLVGTYRVGERVGVPKRILIQVSQLAN